MPDDNEIIPGTDVLVNGADVRFQNYQKWLRQKPGKDQDGEANPLLRVTVCRVVFADIAGDFVAGAVLSQIHYWLLGPQGSALAYRPDRWLAKTDGDWYDELRLTPAEVKRSLDKLQAVSVIKVCLRQWQGHPTRHIKLQIDVLLQRWERVMCGQFTRPKTTRTRGDNASRNQERAKAEKKRVSKSDTCPATASDFDTSSPYSGETNPLITGMVAPNYGIPFPKLGASITESSAESPAEGTAESLRIAPRAARGPQGGANQHLEKNIPSLKEAVAYFVEKGYPSSEAEAFWNYFTAVGWVDKYERPLREWHKTARRWITHIGDFDPAVDVAPARPATADDEDDDLEDPFAED